LQATPTPKPSESLRQLCAHFALLETYGKADLREGCCAAQLERKLLDYCSRYVITQRRNMSCFTTFVGKVYDVTEFLDGI
jgi:hypothetical protein